MGKLFTLKSKSRSQIDTEKYSAKIDIPQYLPKGKKPNIKELMDMTKYIELCRDINKSDLGEEEKEFLKFAATRHIVFNYSKIADYYAHSNKDMQEFMEDSALVIIDFNDAIMNGYVRLSKNIRNLLGVNDE